MWPNTDPRPNVEGHPQHSGGQESPQEMDLKCEVSKKGQVSIARIVGAVIMLLDPT